MKRVLILCTGNSCRSQMAEGIWQQEAGGSWQADSAGSDPAGYVHPLAVRAMQDIGIDISANQSKHLEQFQNQDFDLVVTVCDSAKDSCPSLPGAQSIAHWPFEDPARLSGSPEEQFAGFQRIRDEIADRIRSYLAEDD